MNPSAVADAPVDTGASSASDPLDDLVGLMTGDESSGEPEQQEETAEAAAPETTEEAAPVETTEAAPETTEYQLAEDGQHYLIPKDQLQGYKAQREYVDKVQQWFPTAQDAEAARGHASLVRNLYQDFITGDDPSLDAVLNFFAGGDVSPQHPEVKAQHVASFGKLATRIPEMLAKVSPQAYDGFIGNVVSREIQAAYDTAAASGNPEDFLSAQRFDYGWTGQYRTENKRQDPKVAAQSAIDQRAKDLETRENALLDRDWTEFNKSNIEGKKWGGYYAELDKMLAPVKANYSADIWPDIRDGVSKRVLSEMKKDELWAREHGGTLNSFKTTFAQHFKAGKSPEALKANAQAYINDFMIRARRHMPSIAQSILKSAPAKPVAAPNGRTQAPATQRAPNGQYKPQSTNGKALSRDAMNTKLLDEVAALF